MCSNDSFRYAFLNSFLNASLFLLFFCSMWCTCKTHTKNRCLSLSSLHKSYAIFLRSHSHQLNEQNSLFHQISSKFDKKKLLNYRPFVVHLYFHYNFLKFRLNFQKFVAFFSFEFLIAKSQLSPHVELE